MGEISVDQTFVSAGDTLTAFFSSPLLPTWWAYLARPNSEADSCLLME